MRQKKFNRRDIIKASALSIASLSLTGLAAASTNKQGHPIIGISGLKGKTAFITGGARGIGLSIAQELAKEGVNIVIYDIAEEIENVPYKLSSTEDLQKARNKIEALGVSCLAIQGDVRNLKEQEKAMLLTVKEFKSLDYVVANAAVTRFGNLQSHTEEMTQILLDINIGGVTKTLQAAAPILKKQNSGRIITLSSIAGRAGSPYFSVYASTKWGVIGLTKSVAIELAPNNITCNVICPTVINTKLVRNRHLAQAFGGANDEESINESVRRFHPLPIGILPPVEIAKTALFLCSNSANYITGAVMDVSAGWSANNNA